MPNYEVQKQSNNSSKTVKQFVKMQHDHRQRLSSYKNNNSPGKSAISSKTCLLSTFCFIYLF